MEPLQHKGWKPLKGYVEPQVSEQYYSVEKVTPDFDPLNNIVLPSYFPCFELAAALVFQPLAFSTIVALTGQLKSIQYFSRRVQNEELLCGQ